VGSAAYCLDCIRSLTYQSTEHADMVAQASGCELIIKALVTHHNSYEVQQTGWSTVSNLSEKSELCREALGGVGACEKIVGACGPPSFVAAFQRPCPRLSLRRPFRPPLTLPLPSPLSPDFLATVPHDWRPELGLQGWGGLALINMAADDSNIQRFGQCGAVEVVLAAIRSHPKDHLTAVHGCIVINNLVRDCVAILLY